MSCHLTRKLTWTVLLSCSFTVLLSPAKAEDMTNPEPSVPLKGPINSQSLITNPAARPHALTSTGLLGEANNQKAVPLKSILNTSVQIKVDTNEATLGKMSGVLIEVQNNSDRPLLFDGDLTVAAIGDTNCPAATVADLDKVVLPSKNVATKVEILARDFVVAGVTVGAVPAAGGIKSQFKPILQRYGVDEVRRQDELERFGKRIVWPGDSTKGIVYFLGKNSLKGASINMPVASLFDRDDQAVLTALH